MCPSDSLHSGAWAFDPEERAKAIKIARLLERDPLGKDAAANREWSLNWIIEIPDIHFKSCAGLLSPGIGNQYRYSAEVDQQIIFSAAAWCEVWFA